MTQSGRREVEDEDVTRISIWTFLRYDGIGFTK